MFLWSGEGGFAYNLRPTNAVYFEVDEPLSVLFGRETVKTRHSPLAEEKPHVLPSSSWDEAEVMVGKK